MLNTAIYTNSIICCNITFVFEVPIDNNIPISCNLSLSQNIRTNDKITTLAIILPIFTISIIFSILCKEAITVWKFLLDFTISVSSIARFSADLATSSNFSGFFTK